MDYYGSLRMNAKYLTTAQQQVPNPELLINMISRRVRQLAQGHRPLTITDPRMDLADIALKEVGEGKFSYEIVSQTKLEDETEPKV